MNSMTGMMGGYNQAAGERLKGNSATGLGNQIPSGYKSGRIQNYTPEQMQLFQQMFSNVSPDSYLSKLAGGDEGMFDEMEAPAMRQFQQLQGQTASRFSGFQPGAQSARRGSGFQNSINQQTSDFAQDLASKRQSLQQNAIKELMGLSSNLLGQSPYENFVAKEPQKQPSGWGSVIGSGLGAVGGFLAGGPTGAMSGAQMGYNLGSRF